MSDDVTTRVERLTTTQRALLGLEAAQRRIADARARAVRAGGGGGDGVSVPGWGGVAG